MKKKKKKKQDSNKTQCEIKLTVGVFWQNARKVKHVHIISENDPFNRRKDS